jgi:signal recognition particle receptor subunit beta
VIDSEDRGRIDEAQQELFHIINDPEMRNAVLLVFANKQDMPSAMSATELAEALGLAKLSVPWTVQGTCALTGDGLADGLTWLSEQVGGK